MNVYIDTSILLRRLFGEANAWHDKTIVNAYACELLPIEIGRAVDRLRLARTIDDDDVVQLLEHARAAQRSLSIVFFDDAIRSVAAGPMPTVVGTLDALHLATALAIRQRLHSNLMFATHDRQLSNAARAHGFTVFGI